MLSLIVVLVLTETSLSSAYACAFKNCEIVNTTATVLNNLLPFCVIFKFLNYLLASNLYIGLPRDTNLSSYSVVIILVSLELCKSTFSFSIV